MDTQTEPLQRVVFRRWKARANMHGGIIAFFPDQKEARGLCGSYMHVGQHSAAMYPHPDTIEASAGEYAPLLAELKSIGYNLRIVRRVTR